MTDVADQMLTVKQVCRFFGGDEKPLSASTIYRWVRTGHLAKPLRMGARSNRWRRADCQAALDDMAMAAAKGAE